MALDRDGVAAIRYEATSIPHTVVVGRDGTIERVFVGVTRDFEKAAHWYGRAAEHGHPQAQAALGSLQMLGLGVPKQPSSGYFWLIVSVVWEDSELREDAMWGLGEVAHQLSPEQKAEIARAAVPRWKRGP